MYLKQYFWNSEKFNEEYNYLFNQVQKAHKQARAFNKVTIEKEIDSLIERNPRKFESRLKSDWQKVKQSIKNFEWIYDKDKYGDQEKEELLKDMEWFENKVQHFYMCHSP